MVRLLLVDLPRNWSIRHFLWCLLLANLFLTNSVHGQDDNSEFQTWADFTTFMFISNKSAVGGDIGFRGIVSARDWSQLYIRPTYRYQLNIFDLAGGFAFFQTYNKDLSNVTEWRLFQQVTAHWPTTPLLKFNHRLRLEQRFLNYNDSQLEDESFNRIRYQFMIRTRDLNVFDQKLYFKVATEFFQRQKSSSEPFVNRNRLILVAGHRLQGKWWYELHYIAQLSRQYADDGLKTSEHILRIRFFRAAIFRQRIE